ncbi:unnamed protein product, partial [marine sediment metagenome]
GIKEVTTTSVGAELPKVSSLSVGYGLAVILELGVVWSRPPNFSEYNFSEGFP